MYAYVASCLPSHTMSDNPRTAPWDAAWDSDLVRGRESCYTAIVKGVHKAITRWNLDAIMTFGVEFVLPSAVFRPRWFSVTGSGVFRDLVAIAAS